MQKMVVQTKPASGFHGNGLLKMKFIPLVGTDLDEIDNLP